MLIADSPRPGRYATNLVVPRSLWARPSGVKSATRRCATALRAAPDPRASAGPLRRLAGRPEACPGWRAAQRDSTIGSRNFPSRDPHSCREGRFSDVDAMRAEGLADGLGVEAEPCPDTGQRMALAV